MRKFVNGNGIVEFYCRFEMSEAIFNHIILCESLSFSQGKIRPTNLSERSKFLSSLALVLNGNATCTAVYVHQSTKMIYIARNESINVNDERYFDRLCRQIRIYAHLCFDKNKEAASSEALDQLESLIFDYNSKKIVNRFLGQYPLIIDQLRKMIQWNTDEIRPFVEQLQLNPEVYRDHPLITEKIYLISDQHTEEEYVLFLLKTLREFLMARDQLINNQINPTDRQLILATNLAMILYQSRLFQYILNQSDETNGKGLIYFEKTSAHRRSINLLLKYLLKRKDTFSDLYQTISWKVVPSIEETRTLSVTPKQAFEKIFVELSHSSDQDICNILKNISSDAIYDKHLQRLKRFDKDPIHRVHIHAEILLIDYLIKMNINQTNQSKEVEIGISKMPCLLCSYYIEQLNQKYDRCFCVLNSTNGIIYSKWMYRPDEDETILNNINGKLIDLLQKSIKHLSMDIHRVGPLKSGDSDIMCTSMEEDDFDIKLYRKVHP